MILHDVKSHVYLVFVVDVVCVACVTWCRWLQTVLKTSAVSIADGARIWGLTCMTTASLAVCI